jgi:uncharacterized protein YndB with AHSA1/START domain
MDYETTVEIAAPQEVVWSTLVDVLRWQEWTKSVEDARWVEGSTIATGSRVRIKQPGMPAMVWIVSEVESGAMFAWRSSRPGVMTVATHSLETVANGHVKVTLGIHQSGVLAPIIAFLGAARTRRLVQMEAEGLKIRSEATK